jgi:alpha-amylase/alpha-mannosidase (GH57 family)
MTGNDAIHNKSRYVIIHGHFYQPPRENPWLDIIERQSSAAPYHDWNECVYDQCYRPNAFSRLLDSKGMITDIHNNYGNLSFNFGPTLFSWLLKQHPNTARRIIEADHESLTRFENHGNAIGQVFNHIIMPLASKRDQITQIRWAKAFFKKHFERDPEGLWLAETAINMETVKCLVEEGIRFVILSPSQAEKYKPLSGGNWTYCHDCNIDVQHPYRIFPYSTDGKPVNGHLDVFFFNEPLSREISFGNILSDSNLLGTKINSCFNSHSNEDSAVIIATDGETFGHHKPLSDMCLSYFFKKIAPEMNLVPVNFSWYLAKHPPAFEVTLKNSSGEGTSWSCAHGTGRWSRDCGCKTGGEASWRQGWRTPLRTAFRQLQQSVDENYERNLSDIFSDPWKLRDSFYEIAEARTLEDMKIILESYDTKCKISDEKAFLVRRLIEAQKYMLFAFTSCGWFFSDVSGIETVQNIAYAGRALQLGIEPEQFETILNNLLQALDQAKSNMANITGKTIFQSRIASNLHHRSMIAFTAVMEKMLLSDEKPKSLAFDYHGYSMILSHKKSFKSANDTTYEVYSVKLFRRNFSERENLYVALHQDNEVKITGMIAPAEIVEDSSFTITDPQCWILHPQVIKMDLASIFEESRTILANHFLDRLSKDTNKRYAEWMSRNEKIISTLCGLNCTIPDYIAAPIKYLTTCEWNTSVNELEVYGQEDAVFSKLLALWKKIKKYNIEIDFSESTRILEQLILAELTIFSATLSTVSSVRLRYLLNIVDRFNIPVAKNKIEDLFHSILTGPIADLYKKYKKNTEPDSSEKGNIIRLLNFSRRMNFNTDEFPMT